MCGHVISGLLRPVDSLLGDGEELKPPHVGGPSPAQTSLRGGRSGAGLAVSTRLPESRTQANNDVPVLREARVLLCPLISRSHLVCSVKFLFSPDCDSRPYSTSVHVVE